MTHHYQMPESACLNCGHGLDAAGSTDGKPIDPPKDGDLTLCIRCGAVMAYDAQGKVRGMTDAEMDALVADTDYMDFLATIVKKIHMIRAMKG